MYQIRDKVYADAGCILVRSDKKGYQFKGEDPSSFTELLLSLDDLQINGSFATYSGINLYIGSNPSYELLKCDMVKRRYSNDDQIAIMLNNDADAMQKMQDWRNWSTLVATKIMEVINREQNS